MSTTYLLTILLFIGELRPLLVARGDGDTDRVTVSSTFALALVLTGPLSLAIVSQVLATGLDDFRKKRPPLVCAFNAGQYVLTLAAARLVFALAADMPVTRVETVFTTREILPSLVAAVTFFLVNNGTVGGVVALNSGQRVLAVLREDIRVQGMASAILLGLAPITAVVGSFSLIMVPLMMLPLLGVQHNAWIAAQRQHDGLHDGLTGLPNRELFRHRSSGRSPARVPDRGGRGDAARPGPLQGGQRHPRPPGGRRPAPRGRHPADRRRPRGDHRRPAGRRRVRDPCPGRHRRPRRDRPC
jgi:hypothetical protein